MRVDPRPSTPRKLMRILLALCVSLSLLLTHGVAVAAGVPSASLDVPPETMIGETLQFTVTFDNTGTTTGYGPYIDLFLPAAGIDGAGAATDDGITFSGATYLGQPLAPIAPTPLICTAAGSFTHPLTGLGTPCTPGAQVVVLQLPFGSFTPDQPPAEISITASVSNLADAGAPLSISARAGFRYGNDPLDNAATDPPITGTTATASTTPTLLRITKTYLGPENETATGPNYPRQYLIEVDIASGQTITNLDVTDLLPPNLQFVSLDATTIRGTATATAAISTPSTSTPGGTLTRRFSSVTGTTAVNDATMLFTFFVPRDDAGGTPVIDPVSGNAVLSLNQASAQGDWTPIDARDPGGPGSAATSPTGPEHTLTDRSIAIQKSVSNRTDGANSPGDVLEYTLNFQISDFFAFQNVVIADVLSDGQRFDPSFTPTLLVNGNSFALPAAPMAGANFSVDTSAIGNDTNPATNGSTTLTFRVSNELLTRGRPTGRLIGGCVPTGGTGGPVADCGSYNDGATTGTIVFRAIVQEDFSDTYPSGDSSVDQGDLLVNNVTITGDVLNNSDLTPTGQSEPDTSFAQLVIATGDLGKSVYAVDGVVCSPQPCTTVRVAPGDTITYRLQYSLPTSDFEGLRLVDYLPLPVFNATEVATFNNVASAAAPPAGVAKLGPADTYHLRPGAVTPTLATTGPAADNTLTFTYGNYDAVSNTASQIDLLFTVTVLGNPFADGLFLTNQLHVEERGTNTGLRETDAIVQIQLTEPVLNIRKGVIATSGVSGTFSPTTVGPVAFSAPGGGCPRFTGTIGSGTLATTPINSNLSNARVGDRISFAVVVENTGSGLSGAFDVRIRDTIPAGFVIPAGAPGLNLCVTDGSGAALPFTNIGTGLFDPAGGIELVDPGTTTGALAAGKDGDGAVTTDGSNIAIVTYDLILDTTVAPGQALINTATLFNYASINGGSDFTSTDLTETATVTAIAPTLAKGIVATSEASTGLVGGVERVTIGEIVRYRLAVQLPEGTSANFQLRDRLPTGLTFLNDGTTRVALVSNAGGISSTTINSGLPGCAGLVIVGNTSTVTPACPLPDTAISNSATTNTDSYSSGTDPFFKLGNLVNIDNDVDAEFVVVEFNAVIDNSAAGSNDAGDNRDNDFIVTIGGTQSGTASPLVRVRIAEPSITDVNKTATPTSGDAGDTISYVVTYSNALSANQATAFDVRMIDALPARLALNLPSVTVTPSGGASGVTNSSAGNTVSITVATIPPGGSVTIQYTATILGSATPGETITNVANVTYTSLPGDTGTTSNPTGSATPGASGSTNGERNGSGTPAANDYLNSRPATVTVANAVPVKSIVATSEASTGLVSGSQRMAVGEIVRYRLAVQIPEGSSTNFQLRDELPAGLQFLNDGTARALLVANEVGISSSTLSGAGLSQAGNETTVAGLTPTFVLPDAAVSDNAAANGDTYASGTDVYFKLGDLTNGDSDTDQEFVVVELNALVLNVATNQGGTGLTNTFTPFIGGTASGTSPGVTVVVAEPVIGLSKTVVGTPPTDAGDTFSYQLTLTNSASGDSAAPAFDLRLTDALDARLALQSIAVTKPAYAVVSDATAANTVDLGIDRLNPGDSVTVTITARVVASAPNGATIPNTANVVYTSLPGGGTAPNPTGSTTPGSGGATGGERNGADGPGGALNDYAATAGVNITLAAPTIDKLAPTPAQYTIGAQVTYDILVTLPEGETQGLVVTDDLPPGLAYLSHSLISTAAASGGRLGSDYAGNVGGLTVARTSPNSVPGASGDNLVLTFPTVTTTDDNNAATNTFLVRLVARVLNVVGNQEGTTLPNSASLAYTDPNTGNPVTIGDAPVEIALVEPALTIDKSSSGWTASPGELITFSIVVEHSAGDAETAYDVEIVDALPSGLSYEPGSIRIGAGSPAGTTDATGAPTLRWVFPAIAPGETATVEFDARIGASGNLALPINNTADVTWTSLAGTSADERTGADGPGGALNDYAARGSAQVLASAYTIVKTLVTPAGGLAGVNDPVRFSIVVTNTGGTELMRVPVSDTYDTTYLSFTGATPAADDPTDDGTIDWVDIGPIPPGESRTILVDFTAKAVTTETINTATASEVLDEGENTLPDASDTAAVAIGQPDLQITKTDDGVTTTPGGTVIYRLVYRNVGNIAATGVTISETVPANTTFETSGSSAGWSCADGAPAGTTCTFSIGTVAASSPPAEITFAVTVNSPLPSGINQLANTATIADDGARGPDPTPGDNSASDTTPVAAAPDLQISKTDGGATTTPGGTVVYALSYGNVGTQDADGVVITETVPDNTTFAAASSSAGWSCADGAIAGTSCTLAVGKLAVGATGSANFAVTVDNPLPADVTQVSNTATIADDGSNGPDPTPGDNSASDTTPVAAAPDLWIFKGDDEIETTPGGTIVYTLNYGNRGTQDATGGTITETVPANTTFSAGGSSAGWSCADGAPAGTTCTFNLGTVSAGLEASITFAVRVTTSIPAGVTEIDNSVTIEDDESNGPDPTPEDNASDEITPFNPTAIVLQRFTATHEDDTIVVRWTTTSELNTFGFNLFRSADGNRATATRLNLDPILGQGRSMGGAAYAWTDAKVAPGVSYTYWLQEVETDATTHEYGPVRSQYRSFFPLIRNLPAE